MAESAESAIINWTDVETKALLTIWGSERIQSLLEKSTRNKGIYESVSKELSKIGVERNWKQCRYRIKNLRAKFRKAKERNRTSGEGTSTCPFYDEFDAIIGARGRRITNEMNSVAEESHHSPAVIVTIDPPDASTTSAPVSLPEVSAVASTGPAAEKNTEVRVQRKRSRVDTAVDSLLAKLIKHEEAADKRYLEFEERRMKAEQELEEQRHIREQKHEMEMQTMFLQCLQQMNRPPPSSPPNQYAPEHPNFTLP